MRHDDADVDSTSSSSPSSYCYYVYCSTSSSFYYYLQTVSVGSSINACITAHPWKLRPNFTNKIPCTCRSKAAVKSSIPRGGDRQGWRCTTRWSTSSAARRRAGPPSSVRNSSTGSRERVGCFLTSNLVRKVFAVSSLSLLVVTNVCVLFPLCFC